MNPSTLIFLGLAVVWAVVLLPEAVRKFSGTRGSDSIRSFNQQLSVLHRSGDRRATSTVGRSNVIDLRGHTRGGVPRGPQQRPVAGPRPVPMSVRKRRQEVLAVLGCATVLSLLCTVAFSSVFLLPFVASAALLIVYVALLAQLNQAPRQAPARAPQGLAPHSSLPEGLRTATVGRATPAPRRIAN
ncbi:MAG: hypothetical protein ACYC2O_01265 [Microthrixaceae bacterium]